MYEGLYKNKNRQTTKIEQTTVTGRPLKEREEKKGKKEKMYFLN